MNPIERLVGSAANALRARPWLLLVPLFLAHALLSLPALLPTLRQIGDWDESWYIHWGYRLAVHQRPSLSCNPAVAAFYGVIYFMTKSSDLWLVNACRIGRAVLFVSLWLVLAEVLREFAQVLSRDTDETDPANRAPTWLTGLILFSATPVAVHFLSTPNYQFGNPSDALFAILSGASFYFFLRFYRLRMTRDLGLCSAALGLAAMSRLDGLVIIGLLPLALALIHGRRRGFAVILLHATLPCAVILGGFLALYTAVTGHASQEIAARTYSAFEEGHGGVEMTPNDWRDYQLHTRTMPFDRGAEGMRRIFGTTEQNHGSVLEAISKHPAAAAERARKSLASVPGNLLAAYGGVAALLLFALAAVGAYDLLRRGHLRLLLAGVAWLAPLATYVVFFYRPGYFLLSYFLVFALAGLGLNTACRSAIDALQRTPRAPAFGLELIAAFAVFACVRLMVNAPLRVSSPNASPSASTSAADAEEDAVHFMRAVLPSGTHVAAFGPGPLWTANPAFELAFLDPTHFTQEIVPRNAEPTVQAIYVNRAFKFAFPQTFQALSRMTGDLYDIGYASADGDVQVLLRRAHPHVTAMTVPCN